jgi:regulator of sirC expression with transglutaminase-like and TPR domain
MPRHSDHPGSKPDAPKNRTEQLVEAFTRQMRETYVLLGKSLIPLMEDKPEDLDTLIELGGVYEQLGCMREAATTYERLRQLNPGQLPKRAQAFIEQHRGLIDPEEGNAPVTSPESNEGERT